MFKSFLLSLVYLILPTIVMAGPELTRTGNLDMKGGDIVNVGNIGITDCSGATNCFTLRDIGGDGDIADDLRVIRTKALYYSGLGAEDTVVILPPPAGEYTWTGTVWFAYDSSPPTEGTEDEPDGTGTGELPIIVFGGDWSVVDLKADCGDGADTPNVTYACLRVGSALESVNEPFVTFRMDSTFHVDHQPQAQVTTDGETYPPGQIHYVFFWADGLTRSKVQLYVYTTQTLADQGNPATFKTVGADGIYFIGTDSYVEVTGKRSAELALGTLLLFDGPTDGTIGRVFYNYIGNTPDLYTDLINVGQGTLIYQGPVTGQDTYTKNFCKYGGYTNDYDICNNLTIDYHVNVTPSSYSGRDILVIQGGDNIKITGDCISGSETAASEGSCIKVNRARVGATQLFTEHLDIDIKGVSYGQPIAGILGKAVATISGNYENHDGPNDEECVGSATNGDTRIVVTPGTICNQTDPSAVNEWGERIIDLRTKTFCTKIALTGADDIGFFSPYSTYSAHSGTGSNIQTIIRKAWCISDAVDATNATITLEDGNGNVMTAASAVTCADSTEQAVPVKFTAANLLLSGELLRLDNTNTPSSAPHTVCIEYIEDLEP